ncbi:MAG: hypothetical protein VX986_04055 [Pseudomonadota bacterium]|nr:hypothetical protein [Pseudomonadota bacterium]
MNLDSALTIGRPKLSWEKSDPLRVSTAFTLLFVLLWSDKLSIFGVRLAYIWLLFLLLRLHRVIHFSRAEVLFIGLFILNGITLSVIFASPFYGVILPVYFLFSYLIFKVVAVGYSAQGGTVLLAYIQSVRVYIISGLLIFLVFGFERNSVFTFEPSYLAFIYLPYYGLVFSNHRYTKTIDLLFVFASLLTTQSLFVLAAILFVAFAYRFWTAVTISFSGVAGSLYLTSEIWSPLLHRVEQIWSSENTLTTIAGLAGNRWNRLELAWEIWKENLYAGIGPGNYLTVSEKSRELYPRLSLGPDWTSPFGYPAVNIFLEAGLNFGLVGLTMLSVFIFYTTARSLLSADATRRVFGICIVIMLVFLMFESSIFRPGLWVALGFAAAQLRSTHEKNTHRL